MLFRALQGVGGAIVFATSLALLTQTFTGRQFAAVLGIWGAVITAGLGCAPVLGGLLTEVSWRLIFFANLPVGATAIIMTLIGVQGFRPSGSRRIDLPGSTVFTVGLVALIYGLTESGIDGWGSAPVIGALAAAARRWPASRSLSGDVTSRCSAWPCCASPRSSAVSPLRSG